ncbi:MAG: N-formylglutamate amidohydrolase [Arenicellales bacterium]
MTERIWIENHDGSPLIATAIHAGHEIRHELLPLIALDEAERTREENPYTDFFVKVAPTWLVTTHSRFEVDLSRDREDAIYTSPEMPCSPQFQGFNRNGEK